MDADVVIVGGGVIGTAIGRFPGFSAELEAAVGFATGLRTESILAVALGGARDGSRGWTSN